MLDELRQAQAKGLMSPDTLAIIEGAASMSDKRVTDVMVPRAQMTCINASATLPDILKLVIESGHSRYPVVGEDRDEVLGVLLAKDLLKCFVEGAGTRDIRALLRPASMVPEQQRLDVLLKQFRVSRQHMAVVVDEFGGTSGLITIEDVLEEIVGDISDEHDDEPAGSTIHALADGRFIVHALTPIADLNERFATQFADDEYDTVGGLVTARIGHLPSVGEEVTIGSLHFKVTKADSRRLHQIAVRQAEVA